MRTAKHEKYNILHAVFSLCLAAVLLISGSFAWFSGFSARKEKAQTIAVSDPPILYILDSDAKDITQLSLRGLKIGERKRLVFCVSSVYPVDNDSLGYKGTFSLELVYTNNLSANYKLYLANIEASEVPDSIEYTSQAGETSFFTVGPELTGVDVSTNGNTISYNGDYSAVQEKNHATYTKYLFSTDDTNPNSNLRFTDSHTGLGMYDTLKCRFFILELTWADTSTVDSKETDMVYIIAKSGSRS